MFSRLRIGFVILSIGLYFSYQRSSYGPLHTFISLSIVLLILYFYLNYTFSQFKSWIFTDKGFYIRKLSSRKFKFYTFEEISSYQLRHRLGSVSRSDAIPNYEEINIWLKNKESMSFDGLDFVNYQELKSFLQNKMVELQIEPAPYRE